MGPLALRFFALAFLLCGHPVLAAPGDVVSLANPETVFAGTPDRKLLDEAVHDLQAVITHLHPAEIESPEVSFDPHGPRGLAVFEIRGTVRIGPIPVRAFLRGDVSVRDEVCAAPWIPRGYRLDMTFDDSPEWIRENAAAVTGRICAKPEGSEAGGLAVVFESFMVEGAKFSSLKGPRIRRLLGLQPARILDAIGERYAAVQRK